METNVIKNIVMGVFFFIFLGLIVYGQKTVGLVYLGIELIGLAGLLTLLFMYNKRYK